MDYYIKVCLMFTEYACTYNNRWTCLVCKFTLAVEIKSSSILEVSWNNINFGGNNISNLNMYVTDVNQTSSRCMQCCRN